MIYWQQWSRLTVPAIVSLNVQLSPKEQDSLICFVLALNKSEADNVVHKLHEAKINGKQILACPYYKVTYTCQTMLLLRETSNETGFNPLCDLWNNVILMWLNISWSGIKG